MSATTGFAVRAAAEWEQVTAAVRDAPSDYRNNAARLREYLMVYGDFEPAAEARQKLAQIETAAKDAEEALAKQTEAARIAADNTRRKVEELLRDGKLSEAEKLLSPKGNIPSESLPAAAQSQLRSLRAYRTTEAADSYEKVGSAILPLAAARKYDAARKAMTDYAATRPRDDLPPAARRDRQLLDDLKIVWDAYGRITGGIKTSDTITLGDPAGDGVTTNRVVSVRGTLVEVQAGGEDDPGIRTLDLHLLPATDMARLLHEKSGANPSPRELAGCAALLSIDDLTPPSGSVAAAMRYIEAARRVGEAVEYYREILGQRRRDPAEMQAKFMLLHARRLCQTGDTFRGRTTSIGLKAKFGSAIFVKDNLAEIDRMIGTD